MTYIMTLTEEIENNEERKEILGQAFDCLANDVGYQSIEDINYSTGHFEYLGEEDLHLDDIYNIEGDVFAEILKAE